MLARMSDWSKVTRPIPVPNELSRPFWDAARQKVLALQRCQACKHFQHPPYATCVRCMGIDLKFEPVSGKGVIYAYTIMYHAGDKRFAAAIPYASIIVELDDAPGALLAGNLLEAPYTEVKGAVADSGLAMSDIDGLATYPELPATGHAMVDGITIVSVNCMMAMLKLPNLAWHVQVETVNIGGAVQQAANALLAGVCKYAVVWRAMHNPKGTYQNLPGTHAAGPAQFTAPYGFGGPGQHMAVAYTRWLERPGQSREKMARLAVT